MAVETLPFVQISLPKNNEMGAGTEPGGKQSDAAPGRFESLMAEYAQGEPAAHAPAQSQPEPVLQGKPLVLPVLDPLVEPGTPQPLLDLAAQLEDMADALASLSEGGAEKLTALASKIRSARPSELASLADEAARLVEELAPELEPEAAEALRDALVALENNNPPRDPEASKPDMGDTPPTPQDKAQHIKENTSKETPSSRPADDDEERDEPADASPVEDTPSLAAQAAAGAAQQPAPSSPAPSAKDEGGFELPAGMEAVSQQTPRPELQTAQRGRAEPEPQAEAKPEGEARPSDETRAGDRPQSSVNVPQADDEAQGQGQQNAARQGTGDSGSRNDAGTRGDARNRVDARRPTETRGAEDDRPTERTNAANARTDFQSFFEGALSSRRTGATPAPLSLTSGAAALPERSEMLRDGLVNVVRFVRADGVQRANVVIEPPSLGRVTVELTSSTSGVEASIRVSNEQVRQLVQDQLTQLRMNLEQQGVQVAQFAVDVQQDDAGGRRGFNQEERRRRQGRRVGAIDEAEEAPAEFRVDLEQGLLHWIA